MAKQNGWWRLKFLGGYEGRLQDIADSIEDGTTGQKVWEIGVRTVGWDLETDVPVDGIDLDHISHLVRAGFREGEIIATDEDDE